MRVLLDTHAFLWFINGDPRFSPAARFIVEDRDTEAYLSIVSVWEIAIKISLGKLSVGQPLGAFIDQYVSPDQFQLLPIALEHISKLLDLPVHHRDPFDRMLIAQAQVEGMLLVSADAAFSRYAVQRLW